MQTLHWRLQHPREQSCIDSNVTRDVEVFTVAWHEHECREVLWSMWDYMVEKEFEKEMWIWVLIYQVHEVGDSGLWPIEYSELNKMWFGDGNILEMGMVDVANGWNGEICEYKLYICRCTYK